MSKAGNSSTGFALSTGEIAIKNFCDLSAGMLDKSIYEIEPIRVHVKALRTLAPPAATAGSASACA
jgi:hypothetical protein